MLLTSRRQLPHRSLKAPSLLAVINSVSKDHTPQEETDLHTAEIVMADEVVSAHVVVAVDMAVIVEVVDLMVIAHRTEVTVEDEVATVVPPAEVDMVMCVVAEDSAASYQLLPLPLVSMLETCCLISLLRTSRRSLRALARSSLLPLPLTTED